jgi:peptidoglycan-associated lipoprotein
MHKRNTLMIILASALVLALAGCTGKKAVKPLPPVAPVSSTGAQGSGAGDGGLNGSTLGAGGAGANGGAQQGSGGNSAPVGVAQVIYFDFDSSEIRPEFVATIAAHARTLSGNASLKVRLEGNTDERGSPEYNIGLGERRAQAVRRALQLQGVGDAQAATVSYGEEHPAVAGQSEEAWAKNRRVEIVYLN